MSDEVIPIDEPLLSWNDARAAALRRRFQRAGVFVVNLMSGPGAGKTTLFNLITGDLRVSRGRILVFGRDITELPPHRRVALGIGRTYQITRVFPTLTVIE
ncbi:MAG: hypothetical protein C4345_01075, partial [Chloroflexota bacterium]